MISNNSRRFLNSADSGSERPPSKATGAGSDTDTDARGDKRVEKDSSAMVAALGGGELEKCANRRRDTWPAYIAPTPVFP